MNGTVLGYTSPLSLPAAPPASGWSAMSLTVGG